MPTTDFRVTLLGTGTPFPSITRLGPSTLVQVAGMNLVFDAGRGCSIRLWQLGIPLGSIDVVFLTHYHSDHVTGLPDLWLSSLLGPIFGRRKKPLEVVGPKGIAVTEGLGVHSMVSGLLAAFEADRRIRASEAKNPTGPSDLVADEFDADGVVFQRNGVTVSAFTVDHGHAIKPAYGYRIDYDGRSVVISGDTTICDNVIKHAAGVDLLVHEVASVRPELLKGSFLEVVLSHHTSPADCGIVFSKAAPKLAAFTHVLLLGRDGVPEPGPTDLIAEARRNYTGPLVLGEDLMSFDIGPGGVMVGEPAANR